MKKIISIIMTVAIMATMTVPAMAQDEIKVKLDGEQIQFDVQPQIINDYTMVPMRAIFESLGYLVMWDGNTRTVTAANSIGNIIELTVDSYYMYVGDNTNGFERIVLDIAPQIIDDRTLVPVRAIAEAADCAVDWDGNTRTVTIRRAGETVYFKGTNVPSIENIAELKQINEPSVTDAGDMIYHYEFDEVAIVEYVDFLLNEHDYYCKTYNSEYSFTLAAPNRGDFIVVLILPEHNVALLQPCLSPFYKESVVNEMVEKYNSN